MSAVVLVGLILIFALIGGHLIQLIRVPEVGYFAVGLLMGPSFSQILTHDAVATLEFFSEIALGLFKTWNRATCIRGTESCGSPASPPLRLFLTFY